MNIAILETLKELGCTVEVIKPIICMTNTVITKPDGSILVEAQRTYREGEYVMINVTQEDLEKLKEDEWYIWNHDASVNADPDADDGLFQ